MTTPSWRLWARIIALATLVLSACTASTAQESTIRKNLGERIPALKQIDEISKTPMNGLYEVRVGNELLYTDAEGNFLIQGSLLDTRARRNLTEERVAKLTAIDFKSLPLANAFVVKRGSGARKLAVFTDPRCPYCHRVEQELQNVKDVTLYMFLYPVLGPDSVAKARAVWCAKDRVKTWDDLMLRNIEPKAAACDAGAVDANIAFGQKNRITGTPTLVFADGTRIPGAATAAQIEQHLAQAK